MSTAKTAKRRAEEDKVFEYLRATEIMGHRTIGYVASFVLVCSESKAGEVLRGLEADGRVIRETRSELVGTTWGRSGSYIKRTYWRVRA